MAHALEDVGRQREAEQLRHAFGQKPGLVITAFSQAQGVQGHGHDDRVSGENKVVACDEMRQQGFKGAAQRCLVVEFKALEDIAGCPFIMKYGPGFVKARWMVAARRAQAFSADNVKVPGTAQAKGGRVPREVRLARRANRIMRRARMILPANKAMAGKDQIAETCKQTVQHEDDYTRRRRRCQKARARLLLPKIKIFFFVNVFREMVYFLYEK